MKAGESDPWSPDSRRIAFSAKRDADEQSQIYVLDLASGGEAQRVTNLSTGVRSPKFSPDGTKLLFASTVFPNAADDEANKAAAKQEKERKFNVRSYDSFPIRAWDRWIDEKEPHVFTANADGTGVKDLLAGTKLVAEAGFAGTGGGEGRETISGEWSPDGQSIVFAATTARNTAAFAEVDYALYRVSGGAREASSFEPERIASARGSTAVRRSVPTEGALRDLRAERREDVQPHRPRRVRLAVMKNERNIAQTDRSVSGYAIASDGKTIYFTAEDSGLVKIYSVPRAEARRRSRSILKEARTAASPPRTKRR
jgi:Tol biopolymer transport system component